MKRATNHQNRTEAVGVGHGLRAGWGGVARAFTIIEATIVIGIIALLAGILLLAVSHAKKRGDVVAEQAMVTTLQKAVEKFKMDYGFPPPLVVDSVTKLVPVLTTVTLAPETKEPVASLTVPTSVAPPPV